MRPRRIVSVIAAAALALGLLTGCQIRTGAAAFVGSTEITESQVRTYIERDAPTPATSSTNSLASLVLEQLVDVAVFDKVFQELKITPSANDLSQLHDQALQTVLGDSSTGATADQELRTAAARLGLRASFDAVLVKALELSAGIQHHPEPGLGHPEGHARQGGHQPEGQDQSSVRQLERLATRPDRERGPLVVRRSEVDPYDCRGWQWRLSSAPSTAPSR